MMSRRSLLLTVIAILGLLVALGLQGCGLFGGGGDEEGAAEGEAAEGEAMDGAEGMPAEPGAEGAPPMPDDGGMGGPPPGAEGPEGPEGGEMPAPPGDGAAAPAPAAGGGNAEQLVMEAKAAKDDGDYVTAREKLEQAVAADSDNAEAHRVLGWIYAEMAASGQPSMEQKAVEHFQTFLQMGGTESQVAEVEDALERMSP